MKIKEVIGIDVSKLTMDCYMHKAKLQETFDNNLKAISTMVGWSLEKSKVAKENLLFVFE